VKIEHNKNLKNFNTFQIAAFCKKYVEIQDTKELLEINYDDNFFVIGEGSNVLLNSQLDTVLHITASKITILEKKSDIVVIRAEAGVIWDNFVKFCVENKFYGAENLSFIPGTVGAAPVQNIGAYGVEVQDIIRDVEFFDIKEQKFRILSAKECKFNYRSSIFKNELKSNAIVTAVTFKLSLKPNFKLNYGGLSKFITEKKLDIDIQNVRNSVIQIRKEKLPDVKKYPNAGSFFKNAIVNEQKICELSAKYNDLPYFKASYGFKIPTAWLIEKAGLKALRQEKPQCHQNTH
jgi:UDP-N-acetylmuramate dehydrogenase